MHDTQRVMKILQAQQDLLHDDLDLVVLAQLDLPLASLPLDVLRQRLVHELLHQVQTLLVELDSLSTHHEWAVALERGSIFRLQTACQGPVHAHVTRLLLRHEGTLAALQTSEGCANSLASRLCDLIESLQDLNFALLKSLLL